MSARVRAVGVLRLCAKEEKEGGFGAELGEESGKSAGRIRISSNKIGKKQNLIEGL